jgi:hypothetical protein
MCAYHQATKSNKQIDNLKIVILIDSEIEAKFRSRRRSSFPGIR